NHYLYTTLGRFFVDEIFSWGDGTLTLLFTPKGYGLRKILPLGFWCFSSFGLLLRGGSIAADRFVHS
ncbi:MAG: hypothetical protein AB1715_13505, partial [Acidobacteriota bacterium]